MLRQRARNAITQDMSDIMRDKALLLRLTDAERDAIKAAAAAQDLTVQQWARRLLFPAAGLPAASRPVRGGGRVQP